MSADIGLVAKNLEILNLGAWSENDVFICPAIARTNLSCSTEVLVSSIQWSIWCECEDDRSGSCQDTCSSQRPTAILNTRSFIHSGRLCHNADSSNITYELSFTNFRDEGNEASVPTSFLTVTFPQEQKATRLCLMCLNQPPRHLLLLGEWEKK